MEILIKFSNNKSPWNYKYCNDYKNPDAVDKVVKYILRKGGRMKEDGSSSEFNIFGSIGVYSKDVSGIIDDFKKLKNLHNKTGGVQIKHIIISFEKKPDLKPRRLKKLIIKTLKYFGNQYQLVYAVHEDTNNLHIHIGINSVSFAGEKFNFRAKKQHEFTIRTKKIFADYI